MMKRTLIKIEGIVQGVGFRPFVYNLANYMNLAGHVLNHGKGVEIEIQGPEKSVDAFAQRVMNEAPPMAHIIKLEEVSIELKSTRGFSIEKSMGEGEKSALIAPDSDVCKQCIRELFDPQNRRYRYPFISCTDCGPRYSIITDIPYDRPNTTMGRFSMCSECRAEYESPQNRRFHAQPIGCHSCGPRLTYRDSNFKPASYTDPLEATMIQLKRGHVVAIKGIGGYHLAVNALDEKAVHRLRELKKRDEKPFAVMFPSYGALIPFIMENDTVRSLLESHSRPIILVEKKYSRLMKSASPRNRYIGAMLPYTPLHHLIMSDAFLGAMIMTSANNSDEPIVFKDEDALEKLGGVADAFLTHDREIHTREDDSIERPMSHGSVVLRRSRGYAPVPIMLNREYPSILAVGGDLKNTFCLIKGSKAFLSQHIGDLKHKSVYEALGETIERFMRLLDIKEVEAVAHDMHPDYMSSHWASEQKMAPTVAVQHHHAHMVSLMAETHQEGEAIGIIFDGTGYGEDGGIWGGEFLVGGINGYQRMGSVSPVPLPGGDKAIQEPWRVALAILGGIYGPNIPRMPLSWLIELSEDTKNNILKMATNRLNSPLSHGMGRMFDAASALVGIRSKITFEGQAALELEMALENPVEEGYPMGVVENDGLPILDFYPVFQALVEDVIREKPTEFIAARFHQAVVQGAATVAMRLKKQTGLDRVFLSGGVFQNRYVSDRLGQRLREDGFTVFRHRRVPPNDGGIALGQALIAGQRILAGKEK
ncbi:MAG: carbamoyltransferase HypF [Nitrospinota bacterium]|nr:carbamoyltransferase HypF [Nitrospinota bacterium]